MSGAGFLAGTTSPAKHLEPRGQRFADDVHQHRRTDSSAEVEATASCQPAALAAATMRLMPGRPGSAPDCTRCL